MPGLLALQTGKHKMPESKIPASVTALLWVARIVGVWAVVCNAAGLVLGGEPFPILFRSAAAGGLVLGVGLIVGSTGLSQRRNWAPILLVFCFGALLAALAAISVGTFINALGSLSVGTMLPTIMLIVITVLMSIPILLLIRIARGDAMKVYIAGKNDQT